MYKRALVPVDGSDRGAAIVPFLVNIAQPLDIDVVLLRVAPVLTPVVAEGIPIALDDDAQEADAHAYLAELAATLQAHGLRVTTAVRRGNPVHEILVAARETGADLIAMSTHGRTGAARLLFGSVTEGVLRHAAVPVLVMRHTDATQAPFRRPETSAR